MPVNANEEENGGSVERVNTEQKETTEAPADRQSISLLLETVLRIVLFPIGGWFESQRTLMACFGYRSLSRRVAILLANLLLLGYLIFVIITPIHSRSSDVSGIHITFCSVISALTLLFLAMAAHRCIHSNESYIAAQGYTLNSILPFISTCCRIILESAQLIALPILFLPMSSFRDVSTSNTFTAMVDPDGLRYTVANGIMLRCFLSPSTEWSKDDQWTGFAYTGTSDEANTYILFYPLGMFLLWLFGMSLSGLLPRHTFADEVPRVIENTRGIAQKRLFLLESRNTNNASGSRETTTVREGLQQTTAERDRDWCLPLIFYKSVLRVQYDIFSMSGPISIFFLSTAISFLVSAHTQGMNVLPPTNDTEAGGTVAAIISVCILGCMYLAPSLLLPYAVDVDVVEPPAYSMFRGVGKAVLVCSTFALICSGSAPKSSAEVRAVFAILFCFAFHIFALVLIVFFKPYQSRFLLGLSASSHVAGMLMCVICWVLTPHSGGGDAVTTGRAVAGLTIIIGCIVLVGLVAVALRTFVFKKILPKDVDTMEADRRHSIVSGLRLYSSIGQSEYERSFGCSATGGQGSLKELMTTVLWRPLEPFMLAAAVEDDIQNEFVVSLLQSSFLPVNPRAHSSWHLCVLHGLKQLAQRQQIPSQLASTAALWIQRSFLESSPSASASGSGVGIDMSMIAPVDGGGGNTREGDGRKGGSSGSTAAAPRAHSSVSSLAVQVLCSLIPCMSNPYVQVTRPSSSRALWPSQLVAPYRLCHTTQEDVRFPCAAILKQSNLDEILGRVVALQLQSDSLIDTITESLASLPSQPQETPQGSLEQAIALSTEIRLLCEDLIPWLDDAAETILITAAVAKQCHSPLVSDYWAPPASLLNFETAVEDVWHEAFAILRLCSRTLLTQQSKQSSFGVGVGLTGKHLEAMRGLLHIVTDHGEGPPMMSDAGFVSTTALAEKLHILPAPQIDV